MFHVVTAGACWLGDEAAEAQRLEPGVLALVPHGEGHSLASAPEANAAALFDLPREQVSQRYEILRHGGGGAPTTMICGAVRFEHPAARQLVRMLPRRITVASSASPERQWMQSTLALMAAEAGQNRPGGETLVTRLADILVIQAIRTWIETEPAARTGWLGALQDRQIGRALLLMHRRPDKDWTVAELAGEAAMSRSGFAARFTELVGQSPQRYLVQWRMHLACAWLTDHEPPLLDLAERLGYQSEAAFSRAFKRVVGVSPGAYRRDAGAG
jgi:AraC-like DNA-binding protein